MIGYENRTLREEDFNNDKVDAGDIGSGHQVTALYEIVPANAKGWTSERRYVDNRPTPLVNKSSELAWLKLRYKMPDGDTSKLIERAVPAAMIKAARAPSGDMAFTTAVAAYGQKLRGDNMVAGMNWADITSLAGNPWQPTRKQFLGLVSKAASLSAGETPDRLTPPPPRRPMISNCGANKVQQFVGQLADSPTRQKVVSTSGAATIRWIEPGMMVTQDYRSNRLNAYLGGNGKIGSFNCG